MPNPDEVFEVPALLDYLATASWAFSGALLGAKRGFDVVGVVALALVSATGGGLLRDGLFLQSGPPMLVRSSTYLLIVVAAAAVVIVVGRFVHRIRALDPVVWWLDAFGLGAYSVVGMQLAAQHGLSVPGIILVGLVNAVGGSVLRDVLIRREPRVFMPGELLGLASVIGCGGYQLLLSLNVHGLAAAWATIAAVVLVRLATAHWRISTTPIHGFTPSDEPSDGIG